MVSKFRVVNSLYSIYKLLGVREGYSKNIYCMFHADSKPSAHIYGNSLYCFSCRRFYSVCDIAKFYGISINSLYDELQKQYKDKFSEVVASLSNEGEKNEHGDESDKYKIICVDNNNSNEKFDFNTYIKSYFTDNRKL